MKPHNHNHHQVARPTHASPGRIQRDQWAAIRRDRNRRKRLDAAIAAYKHDGCSISRAAEIGQVSEGQMEYALGRAGVKIHFAEPLVPLRELEAFWKQLGSARPNRPT